MGFTSTLDVIIYIIEIIGVVSFASSGAITAIRKKNDILGVWLSTSIAIFGGGLLRDLIISNGPPHIFWDLQYLVLLGISIFISSIWFIIASIKKTASFIEKHRHDFWIYGLDAIGIAVFCCTGLQVAYSNIPENITTFGRYFYLISLGVISGVGGGMFRDVFLGNIPMVFTKHFYMTPCILGTTIYALIYKRCDDILSIVICTVIITTLRVLATIYKWNMPRANAYNELVNIEHDLKEDPTTYTEVKKDEVVVEPIVTHHDFRHKRKGTAFKHHSVDKTSINVCDNHEDGA